MKNNILEKYKGKVLAVESFGSNKRLYVEDFLGKEKLLNELYKMDCHEITLTERGLKFIDEYYNLDNVVKMILDEIQNGVDYKYIKERDIFMWLKARGNYP